MPMQLAEKDAAVNAASTQWADLLLRKAVNDTGQVPNAGGAWTNSPDIIPNGTTIVSDPNQSFGAATYGQDLGKPTQEYQQNYFYVRAKNLAPGAEGGELYLYYCPANLFLFPSLWSSKQLSTVTDKPSIHVDAAKTNDVVVGHEPFKFTPTSEIHSCLIGRVTTTKNPNPMPADGDIPTMDALAAYICNHPNMAWRNVDLVPHDVPTFTQTVALDTTSIRADQQAQCLIGISFENLTVGSQLAFSAASAVPSGPDRGKLVQLVTTPVNQTSGSLGTEILMVPGGWKTTISYSYWAKTPIMKDWVVRFYAILIKTPGENAQLARHLKPLHALGIPGLTQNHPLVSALGDTLQGVIIGDVSTVAMK